MMNRKNKLHSQAKQKTRAHLLKLEKKPANLLSCTISYDHSGNQSSEVNSAQRVQTKSFKIKPQSNFGWSCKNNRIFHILTARHCCRHENNNNVQKKESDSDSDISSHYEFLKRMKNVRKRIKKSKKIAINGIIRTKKLVDKQKLKNLKKTRDLILSQITSMVKDHFPDLIDDSDDDFLFENISLTNLNEIVVHNSTSLIVQPVTNIQIHTSDCLNGTSEGNTNSVKKLVIKDIVNQSMSTNKHNQMNENLKSLSCKNRHQIYSDQKILALSLETNLTINKQEEIKKNESNLSESNELIKINCKKCLSKEDTACKIKAKEEYEKLHPKPPSPPQCNRCASLELTECKVKREIERCEKEVINENIAYLNDLNTLKEKRKKTREIIEEIEKFNAAQPEINNDSQRQSERKNNPPSPTNEIVVPPEVPKCCVDVLYPGHTEKKSSPQSANQPKNKDTLLKIIVSKIKSSSQSRKPSPQRGANIKATKNKPNVNAPSENQQKSNEFTNKLQKEGSHFKKLVAKIKSSSHTRPQSPNSCSQIDITKTAHEDKDIIKTESLSCPNKEQVCPRESCSSNYPKEPCSTSCPVPTKYKAEKINSPQSANQPKNKDTLLKKNVSKIKSSSQSRPQSRKPSPQRGANINATKNKPNDNAPTAKQQKSNEFTNKLQKEGSYFKKLVAKIKSSSHTRPQSPNSCSQIDITKTAHEDKDIIKTESFSCPNKEQVCPREPCSSDCLKSSCSSSFSVSTKNKLENKSSSQSTNQPRNKDTLLKNIVSKIKSSSQSRPQSRKPSPQRGTNIKPIKNKPNVNSPTEKQQKSNESTNKLQKEGSYFKKHDTKIQPSSHSRPQSPNSCSQIDLTKTAHEDKDIIRSDSFSCPNKEQVCPRDSCSSNCPKEPCSSSCPVPTKYKAEKINSPQSANQSKNKDTLLKKNVSKIKSSSQSRPQSRKPSPQRGAYIKATENKPNVNAPTEKQQKSNEFTNKLQKEGSYFKKLVAKIKSSSHTRPQSPNSCSQIDITKTAHEDKDIIKTDSFSCPNKEQVCPREPCSSDCLKSSCSSSFSVSTKNKLENKSSPQSTNEPRNKDKYLKKKVSRIKSSSQSRQQSRKPSPQRGVNIKPIKNKPNINSPTEKQQKSNESTNKLKKEGSYFKKHDTKIKPSSHSRPQSPNSCSQIDLTKTAHKDIIRSDSFSCPNKEQVCPRESCSSNCPKEPCSSSCPVPTKYKAEKINSPQSANQSKNKDTLLKKNVSKIKSSSQSRPQSRKPSPQRGANIKATENKPNVNAPTEKQQKSNESTYKSREKKSNPKKIYSRPQSPNFSSQSDLSNVIHNVENEIKSHSFSCPNRGPVCPQKSCSFVCPKDPCNAACPIAKKTKPGKTNSQDSTKQCKKKEYCLKTLVSKIKSSSHLRSKSSNSSTQTDVNEDKTKIKLDLLLSSNKEQVCSRESYSSSCSVVIKNRPENKNTQQLTNQPAKKKESCFKKLVAKIKSSSHSQPKSRNPPSQINKNSKPTKNTPNINDQSDIQQRSNESRNKLKEGESYFQKLVSKIKSSSNETTKRIQKREHETKISSRSRVQSPDQTNQPNMAFKYKDKNITSDSFVDSDNRQVCPREPCSSVCPKEPCSPNCPVSLKVLNINKTGNRNNQRIVKKAQTDSNKSLYSYKINKKITGNKSVIKKTSSTLGFAFDIINAKEQKNTLQKNILAIDRKNDDNKQELSDIVKDKKEAGEIQQKTEKLSDKKPQNIDKTVTKIQQQTEKPSIEIPKNIDRTITKIDHSTAQPQTNTIPYPMPIAKSESKKDPEKTVQFADEKDDKDTPEYTRKEADKDKKDNSSDDEYDDNDSEDSEITKNTDSPEEKKESNEPEIIEEVVKPVKLPPGPLRDDELHLRYMYENIWYNQMFEKIIGGHPVQNLRKERMEIMKVERKLAKKAKSCGRKSKKYFPEQPIVGQPIALKWEQRELNICNCPFTRCICIRKPKPGIRWIPGGTRTSRKALVLFLGLFGVPYAPKPNNTLLSKMQKFEAYDDLTKQKLGSNKDDVGPDFCMPRCAAYYRPNNWTCKDLFSKCFTKKDQWFKRPQPEEEEEEDRGTDKLILLKRQAQAAIDERGDKEAKDRMLALELEEAKFKAFQELYAEGINANEFFATRFSQTEYNESGELEPDQYSHILFGKLPIQNMLDITGAQLKVVNVDEELAKQENKPSIIESVVNNPRIQKHLSAIRDMYSSVFGVDPRTIPRQQSFETQTVEADKPICYPRQRMKRMEAAIKALEAKKALEEEQERRRKLEEFEELSSVTDAMPSEPEEEVFKTFILRPSHSTKKRLTDDFPTYKLRPQSTIHQLMDIEEEIPKKKDLVIKDCFKTVTSTDTAPSDTAPSDKGPTETSLTDNAPTNRTKWIGIDDAAHKRAEECNTGIVPAYGHSDIAFNVKNSSSYQSQVLPSTYLTDSSYILSNQHSTTLSLTSGKQFLHLPLKFNDTSRKFMTKTSDRGTERSKQRNVRHQKRNISKIRPERQTKTPSSDFDSLVICGSKFDSFDGFCRSQDTSHETYSSYKSGANYTLKSQTDSLKEEIFDFYGKRNSNFKDSIISLADSSETLVLDDSFTDTSNKYAHPKTIFGFKEIQNSSSNRTVVGNVAVFVAGRKNKTKDVKAKIERKFNHEDLLSYNNNTANRLTKSKHAANMLLTISDNFSYKLKVNHKSLLSINVIDLNQNKGRKKSAKRIVSKESSSTRKKLPKVK